jgi:hypothetical protein
LIDPAKVILLVTGVLPPLLPLLLPPLLLPPLLLLQAV